MKSSLIALAALAGFAAAAPTWEDWKDNKGMDKHGKNWPDVFEFTSTYNIHATPDQVVRSDTNQTGAGQPGAYGYFNYGINSHLDTICYNITLVNVKGAYKSPALTATHIHKGVAGKNGPPKIAFPNPEGDDYIRRGAGCLKGPFLTGILANGVDTGTGFKVAEIEADPSLFFTDVHTASFTYGAVRGQFA